MSKSKFNPRYWTGILMILFISILVYLMSEQGNWARIVGLIFTLAILGFAFYEGVKHVDVSIYTKISTTIFLPIFMFYDWTFLTDVLDQNLDTNYSVTGILNWEVILIPILFLTIPFLLDKKVDLQKYLYLCFLAIVIPLFAKIFFSLASHSWTIIVFLIGITVISDSMGYFGGLLLGKHKLAPRLSPKKTWEGAISSFLFAFLFAFLFGYFLNIFEDTNWPLAALIACSILLPIFSIIGDLIFSSFKRDLQIKDFSNLIPGHGGILDRIDSITIVSIAFVVIYGLVVL